MNVVCESKEKTLRVRPGAIAVRLNREQGEWNIWAGSWTGAQFLGRGETEAKAWEDASKNVNRKKKSRTVFCRTCVVPMEISEEATHPGQCPACRKESRK